MTEQERELKKRKDVENLQRWRRKYPERYAETRRRYAPRNGENNRIRRERLRRVFQKIKADHGCCNPACGWVGPLDPCALDFHHVNPSAKDGCVSQLASIRTVVEEARKCTVLCAVCHRLVTWGALDASGFPTCSIDDAGETVREANT